MLIEVDFIFLVTIYFFVEISIIIVRRDYEEVFVPIISDLACDKKIREL
jgi:hypothetical protein